MKSGLMSYNGCIVHDARRRGALWAADRSVSSLTGVNDKERCNPKQEISNKHYPTKQQYLED